MDHQPISNPISFLRLPQGRYHCHQMLVGSVRRCPSARHGAHSVVSVGRPPSSVERANNDSPEWVGALRQPHCGPSRNAHCQVASRLANCVEVPL
jgi:hypothetical protein